MRRSYCAWIVLSLGLLPFTAHAAEPDQVAWTGQLPSNVNKGEVIRLISNLADDSFEVREAASSRLGELGPKVLPAVYQATQSPDPEVCHRSWRLIEGWASKGEVGALLCQLKSRSAGDRAGAAQALSKVEPKPQEAVPALIKATDDPVDYVRLAARTSLKQVQDTQGLRLEITELKDRVEVGREYTYRIDVTNCGKEPATELQIKAFMPNLITPTRIKGANRPLEHRTNDGLVLSNPIELLPNATVRWEITVRAERQGKARFKVAVTAERLPYPLIDEKTTTIHLAKPKAQAKPQ